MKWFAPLWRLNAELIWTLIGIPLAIWTGVLWDSTRAATETQSFLGASNNIFFLWMVPIAIVGFTRGFIRSVLGSGPNRWIFIGTAMLLVWAIIGLKINGIFNSVADSVVPIVAMICVTMGATVLVAARRDRAAFLGKDIERATMGALAIGGLGGLFGVAAHLIGPLPEMQPFLKVDGFGNIRTMGEFMMLPAAVGLVACTRYKSWLYILFAAAMVAIVAWSGTRAAWVGMSSALLLGIIWWRWSFQGLGRAAVALILGVILSIPIPLPDSNYGALRIGSLAREARVVINDADKIIGGSTEVQGSNRMALWSWGVDKIREKPIIGNGFASMGGVPDKPEYAEFKHLHNLPLDAAFGFGIPVAIFISVLLAWASLSAMHQGRRDGYILLPLIGIATLTTSLFAGLFLFPISVVAVAIGISGAGRSFVNMDAADIIPDLSGIGELAVIAGDGIVSTLDV